MAIAVTALHDGVRVRTGDNYTTTAEVRYKVTGVGPTEDEHDVLAHISGKMRMHFIKILPGDSVTLQFSPYDLNRGRIIHRKK